MVSRDSEQERRTRTLDELEGVTWGPPTFDTPLVKTCHRLRTKPIGEFTTEDLREMIGQQISLFFLVPIALEILEENPLAEGDLYPGDLLANLLCVDHAFWLQHSNWRSRLESIVSGLTEIPKVLADDLAEWRRWQA